MLALLGLLAVAGYQNRDRIKEMIGNVTQGRPESVPGLNPAASGQSGAGQGGLAGLLGGLFGGSGQGNASAGAMHGALTDLIDHLSNNGQGAAAQSWVQNGPNKELSANDLETALGGDSIAELTRRTGLSRDDLLQRLRSVLPTAVDQMTPDGWLPPQGEAGGWLSKLTGQAA
jgi:uncharacterized protein YidB (DUF937 family)